MRRTLVPLAILLAAALAPPAEAGVYVHVFDFGDTPQSSTGPHPFLACPDATYRDRSVYASSSHWTDDRRPFFVEQEGLPVLAGMVALGLRDRFSTCGAALGSPVQHYSHAMDAYLAIPAWLPHPGPPPLPTPLPALTFRFSDPALADYLAAGATGDLECRIRHGDAVLVVAVAPDASSCSLTVPFPTPGSYYHMAAHMHLRSAAPAWALPASVTHGFTLESGTATNHYFGTI